MKKKWLYAAAVGCLAAALAGCSSSKPAETAAVTTAAQTEAPAVQTADGTLTDGVYEGEGAGNNGPIKVAVTVEGGKIAKIEVVEHQETPGLGDQAMDALISQMTESGSSNVDSVTGATRSSEGLKTAVNEALKAAGATDEMLAAQEKAGKDSGIQDTEYTYDVVIAGAGGAGLSAAAEAAASGAKVAVLEKTAFCGGNTLVSGGALNVPGTPLQKEKGIDDSVERFIEDTLSGGDNVNDKELVTVMAENALDAYNWLVDDIHMEFMPDRLQQFGGHSVPRAMVPVGNKGTEMIKKLETRAEELGVDFYMETAAESLIMENGAVTGLTAEHDGNTLTFHTNKGVILATGGFGANVEMREKYNPDYGAQYQTTCTPASTGDGIRMAEEAGAQLIDMQYIQVYPTCNPNTGIISYVANSRFDGALLFNQDGSRFVDEMGRRDVISNAILAQPGGYAYLVWGQEVEQVGNMVQVHANEYQEMEKQGVIYCVDSLEEAAEVFGVDKEAFLANIAAYNENAEAGSDPDFNKGGGLVTIAEGPFYIQKVTPSTHHTMGGVKINTSAQVLNESGEVIPNLYAAGEVVGGVHGTNRLGGNAITDIVVFGRIAGENVVK